MTIAYGHKNRSLTGPAPTLLSGPYVRDRNPADGSVEVPLASDVALTIASVLPRTVDLTTVVIRFQSNAGAPVAVYDGGSGGFQAGYTGSATHGSDATEDFYDFVINPSSDFAPTSLITVEVQAQDDLGGGITPPEFYSFTTTVFYLRMTPWDRELGQRQARIGLFSKRALGALHLVDGAHLVDPDFFTLDDGLNVVEFEYDSDGLVGGSRVPISYDPSDSLATIQAKTVLAINGLGDELRIAAFVNVTEPGTVGLVHDLPGLQGNQPILETVADPGFTAEGMVGGVDADTAGGIPSALEGDFVFCIGYRDPGRFHTFAVGDYGEVAQTADPGSSKLFRFRAIVRTAVEMPAGTAWRMGIRLDDVEFVGRTLEPGRDRHFVDLAVNLAGLIGDHKVAIRVELITV